LGLGIDRENTALAAMVKSLSAFRVARNEKMLAVMRDDGIDVCLEDIAQFAGTHLIGRPHFAAFLADRRIAKNIESAFNKYLGKGKKYYVKKRGVSFCEALQCIHGAGGLALVAHPSSLQLSWGRMPDFFTLLKKLGLDGIEAWHPNSTVHKCQRLEALAKELGLKVSGGSDYHGSLRRDRKLGYTAGGKRIEDRVLEELFA
jgi:predicted metal-dependent phosphoesterase TrpH